MIQHLYTKYNSIKLSGFCALLFLLGCTTAEIRILEGRVLSESTLEPVADLDVSLSRMTRPIFTMRGWKKIATRKTDKKGRFLFETRKPGPYEVSWYTGPEYGHHYYLIREFEGKKFVELIHEDKEEIRYLWDE